MYFYFRLEYALHLNFSFNYLHLKAFEHAFFNLLPHSWQFLLGRYIIIYYHGDFEEDHLPHNQEKNGNFLYYANLKQYNYNNTYHTDFNFRMDALCLADKQFCICISLQVCQY